jgi:hypothetical protein
VIAAPSTTGYAVVVVTGSDRASTVIVVAPPPVVAAACVTFRDLTAVTAVETNTTGFAQNIIC